MSLAGYPQVESCSFNCSEDSSILFARSVENATKYPTNLVYPHGYDYQLEECRKRLDENEASLFGDENVVDILEINEEEIGTYPLRKAAGVNPDDQETLARRG
jgi:hypothetical protein